MQGHKHTPGAAQPAQPIPALATPGEELAEELKEFSDRLAGFGLGVATERLLKDIAKRPPGPDPTPA